MDLVAFRKKIRELYYPTGYSQKMLARELGLQPSALSNKLNGTGDTRLKHFEIKQIIKTLAKWEALTGQADALELLELMKLSRDSFTAEEWNTPPLNKLTPPPGFSSGEQAASAQPAQPLPLLERLFDRNVKRGHNLPAQPNTFIGRKQAIGQLVSLLRRADVRLVTLTGSGGVGKTRLALQVASELLADFESGVVFISLASVNDPDRVLSTIARSLGIVENGNQTVRELLANYLHDKRLLLVLDNFEQVLPASLAIKELMLDLPYLKLLITSRTLLRVYGEYEYLLPPMTLADPTLIKNGASLPELELLGSYEAITLFVQRARATKPGFKLSEDNAILVAQICQRLDGLPLAIELAAANVKTMGLALLLTRLDHSLEFLNRGPRDLPDRQQTLRAMINWSYDLLDPSERQLLTHLSIFAGGCSLNAVEEVCQDNLNPADDDETSIQILNKLSDLVDKSMLQVTQNTEGEPRFTMLETVREYTGEKLHLGGNADIIHERHATYFLKLAEQANQAILRGQQKAWLDKLEIEHDNFRAAIVWTLSNISNGQGEKALMFVKYLWRFWQLHSHFKESQVTITTILNKTAPFQLEPGLRAEVLHGAGVLFSMFDYSRALSFHQENMVLRREMNDEAGVITALVDLGWLALHHADFQKAAFFGEQGLELARKLADKPKIAAALFILSIVTFFRSNTNQAYLHVQECLKIWQELGDLGSIASAYNHLGTITMKKGDYKQARTQLLESLKINVELGNKIGIITALGSLAELAISHRSVHEGAERAAMLLGAINNIIVLLGMAMPPLPKNIYDARVAMVKNQLNALDFKTAVEKGQRLNAEQILALVREEIEPSTDTSPLPGALNLNSNSSQPSGSNHLKTSLPGGLTQRETEVLRLAATGVTTSQIAAELVLSPLTIQAHLRSIYSKLAITSRSAATRYALENNLV